jgi:acetolactate synthase-1/3 small subunit
LEVIAMERHVLSILVENHAGVLSRVTGLFARRCYNIDSLSVGTTEDPNVSRITIATNGEDAVIEQIKNQVGKLVDVRKVIELTPNASVYREIALIKVAVDAQNRQEIVSVTDIFRANIIDVCATSLTIEITGDESKISAFINLVAAYGIKEIVRTGLTGIERGALIIKEHSADIFHYGLS